MLLLLLFFLGLCVGSFLLVVVDRLPRGETIFFGRSHCDKCKKPLFRHDLIPFFSFIFLNGRCRFCKAELSFYYPLVELVTGVLFVLTFVMLQQRIMNYELGIMNLGTVLYFLFITAVLIVVFFTDLRYGIIPFLVVFPAIIVSFLFLILNSNFLILNHLLSALSAFAFFLLLFLITRGRGIGFGDVVLAFFMGLLLGFPGIIVAFYAAFLTGTFISLILILAGKKRLRGSTIPFGPFLILGTYVALLWGDMIVSFALPYIGL